MTIRRFFPFLTACLFGLLLGSCSASRDLPEGQLMLNKVNVVADGKYPDINPSQLKSYVRQKGNSRWFSAVKIPLGVYAMAGDDSTKWINRTLRSMGEAPVISRCRLTLCSMKGSSIPCEAPRALLSGFHVNR